MESRSLGVLDTPVEPGDDGWWWGCKQGEVRERATLQLSSPAKAGDPVFQRRQ
jgi:hypothetical protein